IGRTPHVERFTYLVPGRGTMIAAPNVDLFLGKMIFNRPPHEAAIALAPDVYLPETPNYIRWVMLLPPGHAGFNTPERSGLIALDEVLAQMEGWHPDLRELIRQSDQENSGTGPLRALGPVPSWPRQPVTLLGDAVHATAATGGNGANTAIRDAVYLC